MAQNIGGTGGLKKTALLTLHHTDMDPDNVGSSFEMTTFTRVTLGFHAVLGEGNVF